MTVQKPARRPVKGARSSPRAQARGSLDGPHRAPVTIVGRELHMHPSHIHGRQAGTRPTFHRSCRIL